jgi:hypothetical protein
MKSYGLTDFEKVTQFSMTLSPGNGNFTIYVYLRKFHTPEKDMFAIKKDNAALLEMNLKALE